MLFFYFIDPGVRINGFEKYFGMLEVHTILVLKLSIKLIGHVIGKLSG